MLAQNLAQGNHVERRNEHDESCQQRVEGNENDSVNNDERRARQRYYNVVAYGCADPKVGVNASGEISSMPLLEESHRTSHQFLHEMSRTTHSQMNLHTPEMLALN